MKHLNKLVETHKRFTAKRPEYSTRVKLVHRAKRIVIEDVAITKIGKVFAVISTIKRLVMNYINLNNKGGVNNAK